MLRQIEQIRNRELFKEVLPIPVAKRAIWQAEKMGDYYGIE
jgi:hypothetical protein